MGGGGTQKTKYSVRFAPYLESAHSRFMTDVFAFGDVAVLDSPFVGYEDVETDEPFFGVGLAVSSFASLFDMFGKHMAGLDIEEVFESAAKKLWNKTEISEDVQAEIDLVDLNFESETLPAFKLKMRELNAVNSSSFVVESANIERARTKSIEAIKSNSIFNMLYPPLSEYARKLNWEKSVVTDYAQIMKKYFMTKQSNDLRNSSFTARNTLWPFSIYDFERAALFPFRRQMNYEKTPKRVRSTVSGVLLVLSDTVTGAYIGFQCGGYVGAIVGAVVGFIVGVASWIFE